MCFTNGKKTTPENWLEMKDAARAVFREQHLCYFRIARSITD